MLVLSRHRDESIMIGDDIEITIGQLAQQRTEGACLSVAIHGDPRLQQTFRLESTQLLVMFHGQLCKPVDGADDFGPSSPTRNSAWPPAPS